MKILALDTSGLVASVAVTEDDRLVAQFSIQYKTTHSQILMPMMDAIRQMGLRVPEDISIAGYDGISLIQKFHPRLTTVRQDGEEIGRQAAIRLLSRVTEPLGAQSRPIIVPGELLHGETVRRLN